tara:strand:- start:804 stop:1127 length:324 start_codon:yes stop_codon:yes gene_type:complete
MSQIRFLDQVAVAAFAQTSNSTPSTGNNTVIPRIILPGTTFTVSKNTNVEVSELTVAAGGKLVIEAGTLVIPGPPPIYSHGVLSVTSPPLIYGTVVVNGVFNIPHVI